MAIEQFFEDEDTQDIIIRSLKIIGETTTHLLNTFKEFSNAIPWRDIKNLRNIMIHQYFRIDLKFVWGQQ